MQSIFRHPNTKCQHDWCRMKDRGILHNFSRTLFDSFEIGSDISVLCSTFRNWIDSGNKSDLEYGECRSEPQGRWYWLDPLKPLNSYMASTHVSSWLASKSRAKQETFWGNNVYNGPIVVAIVLFFSGNMPIDRFYFACHCHGTHGFNQIQQSGKWYPQFSDTTKWITTPIYVSTPLQHHCRRPRSMTSSPKSSCMAEADAIFADTGVHLVISLS